MAHRYCNPDPAHRPHGVGAILRWAVFDRLRGRRRRRAPGPPAATVEIELDRIRSGSSGSWLVWLGHASFMGSLGRRRFLIDPVVSDHAGWLYPRYLAPPIAVADLPELTAVMISHNHYDHLDGHLISELPPSLPIVVPEGMERWMRRRGRERVVELGWWQTAEIAGLRITLVPARHWSRRGLFDTNRSLWGGYVVEGGERAVYHAGDTAWFDGFAEIGARFRPLDAAILPIGGYDPGWFMEHYHLTPEQAGRAFIEIGAQRLVPMHWGCFQLTDEPLAEPSERMRSWWSREAPAQRRRLELMAVGEMLDLEDR